MDVDSTVNTDNKEQLHVDETDGSCTTECVSGNWSAEVKQENFTVVKQEPDDVCCVIYVTFSISRQKYVHILESDHVFC